ncbi:MAG: 2-amino-4-hydroxy-6-hydroxymethyldihydropteridine diphosphokinase [Muribaculaceae bacterium]|nr:2-amino-4-hydroxy-6-hydroxymethyldihydropteridine diphosphokinase [Muribaculaceae bacterium]
MEEVYLSFGSNFGDKKANVERALAWIETMLHDVRKSKVYETPEVHGFGSSYYNAVVKGDSELGYEEFNLRLKEYERASGRTPDARLRKEVPIDIDIVLWHGEVKRPVDFSREFFSSGYDEINL